MNYVALDVKAPLSKSLYQKVAGVDVDLTKIRESVRILCEGSVDYQIRVTLSPVLTLSDYKKLIVELKEVKSLVLQKFRPGDVLDPSLHEMGNFCDDEIRNLARFASDYVRKVALSGVSG